MSATELTAKAAVLIVEDEPSVRQTLRALLEQDGFTTYSAGTAEAARRILAAKHVDAVLLDLQFPDTHAKPGSGLDLLAQLRVKQEYLTLPVLTFTRQSLVGSDEDLVRRSREHIIGKPQHYRTLVQHLDRLTRQG